jgi:hypothetical protein
VSDGWYVKATGIEDGLDILERCKMDDNDSDDDNVNDNDNNINHDDYEYPFVSGEYYDSDDENNKNKGVNDDNDILNEDKSRKKINVYLLSQALGFSVKNKFVTERNLNKLMNVKKNSQKPDT